MAYHLGEAAIPEEPSAPAVDPPTEPPPSQSLPTTEPQAAETQTDTTQPAASQLPSLAPPELAAHEAHLPGLEADRQPDSGKLPPVTWATAIVLAA